MFFVKNFTYKLTLSPEYIGPDIFSLIKGYLTKNVEGSCSSSGYVIAILRIDGIGEGEILLSGHVVFRVSYQALVLRPVMGEVLDAPIVTATKMGFFAAVGPLSIFISNYQIPQALLEELSSSSVIRLKIIGTKIDNQRVYAIGTLNDDYLGVVS